MLQPYIESATALSNILFLLMRAGEQGNRRAG